jgi:AcrR family transcriptional regulator
MSTKRTERPTRRYRTAIRRGEARTAIVRAATELFAARGYFATSVKDIAVAARVAHATVFAAVGNKPAVFRAALEAAVEREEPGVPVTDLSWVRAAVSEPDPRRILELHAHNSRKVGERISDLYWAAQCAAESDADVRQVFATVEAGRRHVGRAVCAAVAVRGGLRHDLDEAAAADVLDAVVSPSTWRALVGDAGWEPDRWERWAAETSAAMLLGSAV